MTMHFFFNSSPSILRNDLSEERYANILVFPGRFRCVGVCFGFVFYYSYPALQRCIVKTERRKYNDEKSKPLLKAQTKEMF